MENEEKEKVELEEINVTADSSIVISEEVVSVIAGIAVSEVSGVVDTAGGFAGGISEVLSGKKKLSKGIKVEVGEKETKIDVNIIVEYFFFLSFLIQGAFLYRQVSKTAGLPERACFFFCKDITIKISLLISRYIFVYKDS